MKPGAFEFSRPASLANAVAALAGSDGTVMAIAGGQSLVPMLALRMASADRLIELGRLPELREVSRTANSVMIGASVTHAAIEDGEVPDTTRGLLATVAAGIAYRAIRNFGTIGGSVALADPAADWPVCLMALDAQVHIIGPAGPRRTPIRGFISSAYTTRLDLAEIITAIEVPNMPASAHWGVSKLARKAGAFAGSLAVCVIDGETVTVALGGAVRCPALLDAGDLAASVAAADPDGDAYQQRCHMVTVRRAIAKARAA